LAAAEGGILLNMKHTRTLFLSTSLVVVMLFSGVLLANRSTQDVLFRALGNLAEVVHLVETEYVDELNQEALSLSLDAGLVESLDVSAAVLPVDRLGDYLELLELPPPYGLGLTSRLGSAAVHFVLSGSPAETAGLDIWEVIEQVEGVNSRGRPLWQIRLELMERERNAESVRLTVFDREVDERREVVLDPSPWTLIAATAEKQDRATVILIDAIPADSVEEVVELLPPKGPVILDLRQLRWGIDSETIALADRFVSEGILGQWKGRRAGSRAYTATAGAVTQVPPLVLVGPQTEGVGEILAVALQKAGATIVGQQTLGHAPYMSLVRDGDVAVWMPVGQWLRTDEEPIDGNGIVPDEIVEAGDSNADHDPVLDRALELLARDLEKAA
jgi:C-terminal processing protease CtpA/Prc